MRHSRRDLDGMSTTDALKHFQRTVPCCYCGRPVTMLRPYSQSNTRYPDDYVGSAFVGASLIDMDADDPESDGSMLSCDDCTPHDPDAKGPCP